MEIDYKKLLDGFYKNLPKFNDGRIDYTDSDTALVIDVFVIHNEHILILKRSDKVSTYQKLWMVPAGYLDELISPEEKAKKELKEEVDIDNKNIKNIEIKKIIKKHDPTIPKTWYIIPVLITLKHKAKITLDWEHTEFKWIKSKDFENYKTVPGLYDVIKTLNIL